MPKKSPEPRSGKVGRSSKERIFLTNKGFYYEVAFGNKYSNKRKHTLLALSIDSPLYLKLKAKPKGASVETTWIGVKGVAKLIKKHGVINAVFYPDRRQRNGSVKDRGKRKI